MSAVKFSIEADRQVELLTAASFAIGYLDAWLRDMNGANAVPRERREDVAQIVTTLEAARDAVSNTQTVEFV